MHGGNSRHLVPDVQHALFQPLVAQMALGIPIAPPDTPTIMEPILSVKFFFLLLPLTLYAQTDAGISHGRALFRTNCAFCHGLTAEGGRGPNLVSAPLHHGESDEDLRNTIRQGVPGTTMPSFENFSDDEVRSLVDYLRSVSRATVKRTTVLGDPQTGRQIYTKSGCPACHRIGREGSVFGPDLSRIGASRPLEYLRESVVHPSADIPPEFEGVTAVLKNGKRVHGVRVNEDTFTLQLRDPSQRVISLMKDEVQQLTYDKQSLMPAYDRLSPADLQNLLAYLASITGTAHGAVKEAEGIR